jgi:two-component sensor histidine kinase
LKKIQNHQYLTPNRKISLICNVETAFLNLDSVTALGIIVAEIVTNCYDHAFDNDEGTISVSLSTIVEDNAGKLIIKDNGKGFVINPKSKRHGLGLVARLVEQVSGKWNVHSSAGTTWTITFPLDNKTEICTSIDVKST